MTSAGHPRAGFRRAIERGNLAVAETTTRAIGRVNLVEVLELTARRRDRALPDECAHEPAVRLARDLLGRRRELDNAQPDAPPREPSSADKKTRRNLPRRLRPRSRYRQHPSRRPKTSVWALIIIP
jgi:hypothetical protein